MSKNQNMSGIRRGIKFILSLTIMAFFLLALQSYDNSLNLIGNQKGEIESLKESLKDSNEKYDSLEYSIWLKAMVKHNYVYDAFYKYNKNIDACTVDKFIEVMEFYKLDTNTQLLNTCIAQIIHESGAKHHWNTPKWRRGKVVESSGHAMGLTQIVPTTAFHFLRGIVSKEEKAELYALGCTDFEFVYNYRISDGSKNGVRYINPYARRLVKDWLRDEANNIALWGFITKYYYVERNYSTDYYLLAYNQGSGFLNSWVRAGKQPRHHVYVKRINYLARRMDVG